MRQSNLIWLVLLLVAALASGRSARAQDASKSSDEELEKFLKKVDAAQPSSESRSSENSKAKPADKAKRSSGEVEAKDKELDNFLEKLGATKETPAPDDRRNAPAKPGDKPDRPGKPAPNELKGEAKDLDRHLEELTGRRRRRKDPREDEGSGPLGKIIKEMRDVEQRLGKPDTGEETRQKQEHIVKNLDQIIEQLKSMNQSQGRRVLQLVMRQGQRPGQQPGQQPGRQGGYAPNTKPIDPKKPRPPAGIKDEWGHLPPEVRQELLNMGKEEDLPQRAELIKRYFLSLSKKTLSREE